jgi:hypothetical protein
MRIDLFNSTASEIASEKSSQQVGAQKAAGSGQVSAEDRTTLTSDSTSVGFAGQPALSSPGDAAGQVDSLRQSVNQRAVRARPGKDRRVHASMSTPETRSVPAAKAS